MSPTAVPSIVNTEELVVSEEVIVVRANDESPIEVTDAPSFREIIAIEC